MINAGSVDHSSYETLNPSVLNSTLAIFKKINEDNVIANSVKQPSTVFQRRIDMGCFADARNDRPLCQIIKMAKVDLKNSVKGFTLIEVLLALAILAIALTALLKATAETIHNTNRIKEKSIQHWVEMQAIASVQLNITPLKLNQSTTQYTEMLGQPWYWRAQLTPTPIKTMQQINVTVSQHKTGPFTDLLVAFKHEE